MLKNKYFNRIYTQNNANWNFKSSGQPKHGGLEQSGYMGHIHTGRGCGPHHTSVNTLVHHQHVLDTHQRHTRRYNVLPASYNKSLLSFCTKTFTVWYYSYCKVV